MRPAARQRRPRPRRAGPGWPGRVGGWALSRAPRSRLAPPQAEPPSPAPSVSLPCSRRGRSDLQRSRGARSVRLGAAPPGPGDGGGRGRSPPAWAPRHCQVRAPAPEPGVGNPRRGSRGPAACGCLQSGALRGWEPTARSRLPRSTSFRSSLTPTLPPFPIFPSLDFSSPCLLSACLPPLPLPSPSCPVFLHLLFLFAFSFPYLSFPFSLPFPALLSFPRRFPLASSSLPAILFPTPPALSFSSSSSRLPLWSPGFPLASLFLLPSGGKGLAGVCLLSARRGGSHSYLRGAPQEEREETAVGRVRSPAPFPKPLLAAPSQTEVPQAWSDPRS